MTLDGLEAELRKKFKQAVKFQLSDMVNLVRYADDFIITGRSKEMLENEVNLWWQSSFAPEGWNSRQRRPASRISTWDSTSSDSAYASTTASY